MASKAELMSALAVQRLHKPGLYFVGGVAGLALQVLKTGGRTWILRATIGGKRRDMGLGGYPDVSLSMARDAARTAREKIRAGIDPIAERQSAKSALLAEQGRFRTFRQCADAYISSHESAWKNAKHCQQWKNTLERYVYPQVGNMAVQHVDLAQVMAILEPLWQSKTETAKRLRGRIEVILDWAITREYRDGPNPARWRGHLDKLLPPPNKLNKHRHFPALPVSEVGHFITELEKDSSIGAKALRFAILTAARSGEVRGARWSEIDLPGRVWTIPAERMKAGRAHRVPLSDAAFHLLTELPYTDFEALIFPSVRGPKTKLADITLTAALRKATDFQNATVHGFRSTFRDWASEYTNYPRDVCEMALAHAITNKVEAAYRRGDLFIRRKALMTDWANFCERTPEHDVLPLNSFREKTTA